MNGIFSAGFVRIQKYSSEITLAGKQFEILKLRPWWCIVSFDPLCRRKKLEVVIPVQPVNSVTFNLFGVAIR